MNTVITAPPPAASNQMATARDEQRFLLTHVSWEFYERLLEELGDRPFRVTFDRGNLELMSPSYRHDSYGQVLGKLFDVLADELDLPMKSGGSTTFRHEDVERGLEGDDCFWIENVEQILGKTEIVLGVDPPPDIAFEVDITRSCLDRMAIYAALRVPQVWRFDGKTLEVYCLRDDGTYERRDRSPAFAFLPLDKVAEFLIRSTDVDDLTLRREFRAWLRDEALPSRESDPKTN